MSSSDVRATRRALVAGLAAVAALAGCGFHLRGQASYRFDTIFVSAPAVGQFAAELKRALAAAGSAKLVDKADDAQVVLEVSAVTEDKAVLSLSSGGRVREFALAKRVVFRLFDKEGREWLPNDEIVIRRTYLYDDTERLAREIQEQRLLKEMQTDAVLQIVRQLQAARLPA